MYSFNPLSDKCFLSTPDLTHVFFLPLISTPDLTNIFLIAMDIEFFIDFKVEQNDSDTRIRPTMTNKAYYDE